MCWPSPYFSHGDIIYMKETGQLVNSPDLESPSSSRVSHNSSPMLLNDGEMSGESLKLNIVEDEIDVLLSHQSGLIKRKKHPLL